MTTKTPTGTVRAPGFYEGAFVRERILDVLAARAGLDPAEIRRRNLARPADQPYTVNTVAGAVMGRNADFADEDFGAIFEHALKAGRYEARVAECRERNAAGGDVRYGVGLAAVVETSGTGPFESAKVILTSEGRIAVAAGATSLGQGLPTTLAQVCAEVLQVPVEHITVHLGDTRWMPNGVGSSASRSAVMAGSAVHHASTRLREQIAAIAAARFEASPADIELADGAAFVRGVPDRRCSLREIAALAASPLESEWRHEATRAIGSFGFHLSVVGVDVTTGEVRPETHFVLCDVGRALNPAIVEGQLVGAVIQGIGHATMEELVYDSSGQLLTGTFMDYAMPTAARVPAVELVVHESAAGVESARREGRRGGRHIGSRRGRRERGGRCGGQRRCAPRARDRAEGQGRALSPLLSAVQMLLAAMVLAACSVASTPAEPIDASLREEARRVDVPETDATIVVTSYRPRAWGPLPWIVMSHGTAPTPEANRTIGRYRSLNPIREWVRRGYAVVVPVRRGYGASGGDKFGDSYGSCNRPDFRRAGEGAAADILAAVQWAKTQSDFDPKRWLLVGQSSGGFASIYTASKAPRRARRGARVRARPRRTAGHAPGITLRAGSAGQAVRVDRAADCRAGAVVLRRERRVHRTGRGKALVRELPRGRWARRLRHDSAVSRQDAVMASIRQPPARRSGPRPWRRSSARTGSRCRSRRSSPRPPRVRCRPLRRRSGSRPMSSRRPRCPCGRARPARDAPALRERGPAAWDRPAVKPSRSR
jgi:dienelactone hydrolase